MAIITIMLHDVRWRRRSFRLYNTFVVMRTEINVSNLDLFGFIAIFVVFDIGVLSYATFNHSFVPSGAATLTVKPTAALVCSCAQEGVAVFIFATKFVLLAVGVFYANATRNVTENLNESSNIATALYNIFIFSVAVIPIIYIVEPSNPNTAVVLASLLISYIAIFTLLAVYTRRFYYILTKQVPPELEIHRPSTGVSSMSATDYLNQHKQNAAPSLAAIAAKFNKAKPAADASATSPIAGTFVQRRELGQLNLEITRYIARYGLLRKEDYERPLSAEELVSAPVYELKGLLKPTETRSTWVPFAIDDSHDSSRSSLSDGGGRDQATEETLLPQGGDSSQADPR
jgi:hypothetical protein